MLGNRSMWCLLTLLDTNSAHESADARALLGLDAAPLTLLQKTDPPHDGCWIALGNQVRCINALQVNLAIADSMKGAPKPVSILAQVELEAAPLP